MSTTPVIIADFETSLSTAVAIAGTTFDISSATDDDGVALPTGTYCFTVDNGSSAKEYLLGTLTGSTVTAVQSVSRQGVLTTGAARAHRVGASVIITDFVAIKRVADILAGTDTLNGAAPLTYDTAPTISDPKQLATVAYVLSVVTGGTVYFSSQTIAATAGESLTGATTPVWAYFKESDQRWWKVDTDDSATYLNVRKGFAISTATAGNAVTIQLSGICTGFTALTAGSKYYASSTGGAVTTTVSSDFIGWAFATTSILMSPNLIFAPTSGEKDAMVGSDGTPSSTNKFLTAQKTLSSITDQSQTTQNTSTTVGEANATTKHNKYAQSFIAGVANTSGATLYRSADTGTFTGTVSVAIQADSAGAPSGSNLKSVTITNAAWLVIPVGAFEVNWSAEQSLTIGSTYWLVVTTSTSDNSNHPNLGVNSAGGYGSGVGKYNNSTDGWVADGTNDLYFKIRAGILSQLAMGTSTGFLPRELMPEYVIDITNTNTAGTTGVETTVYTKLVPADVFNTNGGVRLKFDYDQTNAGVNKFNNVKVKLNGTTLVNDTNFTSLTANLGINATCEVVIMNNNSQSAQIFQSRAVGTYADGTFGVNVFSEGTSAVDTSSGVAVITVTFTCTSTAVATFNAGVMEKVSKIT